VVIVNKLLKNCQNRWQKRRDAWPSFSKNRCFSASLHCGYFCLVVLSFPIDFQTQKIIELKRYISYIFEKFDVKSLTWRFKAPWRFGRT